MRVQPVHGIPLVLVLLLASCTSENRDAGSTTEVAKLRAELYELKSELNSTIKDLKDLKDELSFRKTVGARSSEARATLGALKDRARVAYLRNNTVPKTLEDLRMKPEEITGAFFKASDYSFGGTAEEWRAVCANVFADEPKFLGIRANLITGKSVFSDKESSIAARESEARAMLGALRDVARIHFARHDKAPQSLDDLKIDLSAFDGAYFKRADYKVSGTATNWIASCADVYDEAPHEMIVTANLKTGVSEFSRR